MSRLFDFNSVTRDDTFKIITSLDPAKTTTGVIPTKLAKLTWETEKFVKIQQMLSTNALKE